MNIEVQLTPLPAFTSDTVIVMCFRDTDFSSGPKPTALPLASESSYTYMILTAPLAVRVFGPAVQVLLAWAQPCSFACNTPL